VSESKINEIDEQENPNSKSNGDNNTAENGFVGVHLFVMQHGF